MKTRFDRSPSSEISINVLPLLDVVFCILAFFVLTSAGLVSPTRLGITLPQDKQNPNTTIPLQAEMLIVTLDKDGNRLVQGEKVSPPVLEKKIKLHLANFPRGIVVLNAEDSSVTYQEVIVLLQELKKVAGNRVAIATTRA